MRLIRSGFITLLLGAVAAVAAVSAVSLHLGAGSAEGQEASIRHEHLMLNGLPKTDSPQYRYLLDIAGDIDGERMDMSGAEIWSVPADRLDMLQHAAAEQGVTIDVVGADFNKIMSARPMSAGSERMPSEKAAMLTMTSANPAVRVVSMLDVKPPAELEFALARGEKPMLDMNPVPLSATSDIEFALPDGSTITAARRFVETTALGCFWHGTIAGTHNPISLMWWPGGRLTGTFQHDDKLFVIRNLGGTSHALVEMDPRRMPPEHPPIFKRAAAPSSPLQDASDAMAEAVARTGEAVLGRPDRLSAAREAGDAVIDRNRVPDEIAALLPTPAPEPAASSVRQPDTATAEGVGATASPTPIAITVLVAYTDAASRHYTDIERDLIALAIEQTNQSFRDSGVAHVKVELAGAVRVDYDERDGNHFNHLWRMVDRGDGHLEGIHALRDERRADVVVLVVDSPTGCGLATRVAAHSDEAFAVVHHGCATTSYSLAHEIGHIIGARHDRSLDTNSRPFRFGHGHVNGKKWRTIMAYENACETCPRLPIWSSPNVVIGGDPAGDADTDNARVIAEGATRVAAFR